MNDTLARMLKQTFAKEYGKEEEKVFFAPGRVNLIGEHTDYNGGYVFPCALPAGTYGMIAPREDSVIRMYSLNLPESGVVEVELGSLEPGRTKEWTQYPEGVFWSMMKRGMRFTNGADLMFAGDVPAGAGLSSSASMEVLTGRMLRDAFQLSELTDIDLALIGQEAENAYCGMQCGIMDQFVSAKGKAEHAVYLNTATLDYQLVPLHLCDYELLITNSNVKHSLVSSAYNDRRRECALALEDLKKVPELAKLSCLCDLEPEDFACYQQAIKDPVCRRRAKHAVFENTRTKQAVEALQKKDIKAFGRLLDESHISLRDDYEVSCKEIDYLVEQTRHMPGVVGSRMTGGGFGGCTISIVEKGQTEAVIRETGEKYRNAFGRDAAFYGTI